MISRASRRAWLAGISAAGLLVFASTGLSGESIPISLADATIQAIESNLDLLAQRRALEAAREEIGLERSALLPQVDVGARAQRLNDSRADSARGNNTKESLLLAAKIEQTLYDEESWASFDIQKHIYASQVAQLESFRNEIVQETANAFLELERAIGILDIQERNRELTRDNLATSRSLVAAGWSGQRDILRWESQLAANDASVREAQARVLQNRFELNRLRNRAPETPIAIIPATLDDYGFMYSREAIQEAITDPEQDQRMRDFLVRVGIRRSPDLAAVDATISGAERQLTSSQRAFWVPTFSLAAGIDHQAVSNSSDESFDETEWGVQGVITFPLFSGGAKLASKDQAVASLASQRAERSATARTLSQSIRSAFAESSASFESVDFARRQVDAARRNFELVDASYKAGIDSILDLLDAQAQLLTGELSHVNATYDFLEDLIAAQLEISFYACLERPADVASLLDQLEQEILRPPTSPPTSSEEASNSTRP